MVLFERKNTLCSVFCLDFCHKEYMQNRKVLIIGLGGGVGKERETVIFKANVKLSDVFFVCVSFFLLQEFLHIHSKDCSDATLTH